MQLVCLDLQGISLLSPVRSPPYRGISSLQLYSRVVAALLIEHLCVEIGREDFILIVRSVQKSVAAVIESVLVFMCGEYGIFSFPDLSMKLTSTVSPPVPDSSANAI